MVSLIARTPGAGLLPVEAEAARLEEIEAGPLTSIAPFAGQTGAVTVALGALGLAFPAPGESHASGTARIFWTGHEQAFLSRSTAPETLHGIAALTDQSDAWVALCLSGASVETVLARLLPLDLRAAVFPLGKVARSALGHHPLILLRIAADAFELFTFRSMATSAVHEIHIAMKAVAARA